ncbi:21 kDa protein-like [Prosopis cineraria]|uniref:21 kDa protein-like n=1 Tax=Prosopis cineraria TaxID=364024 RepID=UPI002410B66A|nr:21 kDa protein-like [Prosopis cineraria]
MRTLSPQLLSPCCYILPSPTIIGRRPSPHRTHFIRSTCNTTDNPDICYSSIPSALAIVGITVALPMVRRVASDVSALSRKANDSYAVALSICVKTLGTAIDDVGGGLYWLRQLAEAKGRDFEFKMFSLKTELSAAITYETTCTDGFKDEPEVR